MPLSGLVGYWPFDDGSGTTAVDASGNGHNATLVNGVTWVTGHIGGAVQANGTNQYITIPAINLTGIQAITIAYWIYKTSWSASIDTVGIEATTNFNSSTTGFIFEPDSTGGGSGGGLGLSANGNVGANTAIFAQPSANAWHHLAGVYDKTQTGTGQIKFYLDGVLQTPLNTPFTNTNTNDFGNNSFFVFARGGTSLFLAAIIDDLQFYSRALSAAEVQQVFMAQDMVAINKPTNTPVFQRIGSVVY